MSREDSALCVEERLAALAHFYLEMRLPLEAAFQAARARPHRTADPIGILSRTKHKGGLTMPGRKPIPWPRLTKRIDQNPFFVCLPERTIAATQPDVQWSGRYEQNRDLSSKREYYPGSID
jgi:hypothetical protein